MTALSLVRSPVIRSARHDDLTELVGLGIGFVRKMPGPQRNGNWQSCKAYLSRFLVSQHGVLFVAERGSQLTGFICGIALPCPFTGNTTAIKNSWIVDPSRPGDGLALLECFEEWAREQGAERIIASHMHADDGVGRLLKRRGYVPTEINYERLI